MWENLKDAELTYKQRDSWEKLRNSGQALLEKFVQDELPKISRVEASEKVFTLDITTLDLPFVGVIDLAHLSAGFPRPERH